MEIVFKVSVSSGIINLSFNVSAEEKEVYTCFPRDHEASNYTVILGHAISQESYPVLYEHFRISVFGHVGINKSGS